MSMDATDDQFRQQLEQEHAEAKKRFADRKDRSHKKAAARKAERGETDEVQRQKKLREAFYKEKGYKRYVNSRGKEMWLLPEEHAWRTKARKQRNNRHAKYTSMAENQKQRQKLVWVGLVLMAVVIGLAMLR